MPGTSAIHEFLQRSPRALHRRTHRPAFTAQEEDAATHVPGRDWAKVVVCFVDSEPVEAVVPAPFIVNLDRLLELTGAARFGWRRKMSSGDCSQSVSPARCLPSARSTDRQSLST